MTVEEKVKKRHAAADRLLKDSGLIEVLKKHGQVIFTGSYQYNLILTPDIDVYVVVDKPSRKLATKLLNELIEEGWWQNYELGDFFQKKFRTPKWDWLPKGIYLQAKTDFEDERWKVDIWMVDSKEQKYVSWNDQLGRITPEERAAILQLKNERIQKKIECTVHEIYEAVLYKRVRDIEGLRKV